MGKRPCVTLWNLSLGRAARHRASPGDRYGSRVSSSTWTLERQSGEAIPLTRAEFALLRAFVSHPGRVLSRDVLFYAVAKRPLDPFDRSVDVLVSRLRRKI